MAVIRGLRENFVIFEGVVRLYSYIKQTFYLILVCFLVHVFRVNHYLWCIAVVIVNVHGYSRQDMVCVIFFHVDYCLDDFEN